MFDKEILIQKADKYYDLAIEAYESQRYAIAQDYLNQCLEINPEDHEAWTLLASCLEKDGELTKATLALMNRAIIYRQLSLLDKMEADISLLSKQHPFFYRDCIRVAVGLGRLRRDKLALRFFEMSYKKQKDDPDLYYYWGIALANTGEVKKALEKWNVIGDMYNPRLEDHISRAREILAGKREYCRFEYIAG